MRNADDQITPYDNPDAVIFGTGSLTDPLGVNGRIWHAADQLEFR